MNEIFSAQQVVEAQWPQTKDFANAKILPGFLRKLDKSVEERQTDAANYRDTMSNSGCS